MHRVSRYCAALFLGIAALGSMLHAAAAQSTPDEPASQCLAVASALPNVVYVSASADTPLAAPGTVKITYAGHSTYQIETPAGVRIATDFSGYYGADPLPRVITMNQAHSTHFTPSPDPAIEIVLPGWNPDGPEPAKHRVVVDDVYVRNVTTDIRAWGDGGMVPDANSIFIFEVAGLCIGHLGHLHHRLTDDHYAQIGRLDIVMVPVDGGLTLSHVGMAEITNRLRSSVVLPMHLRGTRIDRFLAMMGREFAVDFMEGDTIDISIRDLPRRPTIMVPASLAWRG